MDQDRKFAAGVIADIHKGSYGFIDAVFVEETLRHQGLGTFLLQEAEKMAKKENRFTVTFRDGGQLSEEGVRQILVDTETGVNYLVWKSGYAGGSEVF